MPLEDKKHRSVILFSEWKKPLRALSLEQKGLILDALLDFPDGRRPDFEDPLLAMAWEFMEGGLEANAKKWDEIRERRSDAGRKGAEKRWKPGGKETGSDSKNGKCLTPMAKIAYMFLYLILYLFLVLLLVMVLFLILILYRRPHRPTMATRTTMTRRRPNSW